MVSIWLTGFLGSVFEETLRKVTPVATLSRSAGDTAASACPTPIQPIEKKSCGSSQVGEDSSLAEQRLVFGAGRNEGISVPTGLREISMLPQTPRATQLSTSGLASEPRGSRSMEEAMAQSWKGKKKNVRREKPGPASATGFFCYGDVRRLRLKGEGVAVSPETRCQSKLPLPS